MNALENYTIEFHLETPPKLLFKFISTPEGLSRWFAQTNLVGDNIFVFQWPDNNQKAKVLQLKESELVVFQWLDDYHQGHKLELRIITEPGSAGSTLIISDVAEAGDVDFSKRLWVTQLGQLKRLFKS